MTQTMQLLERAPVVEAILDIECEFAEPPNLAALEGRAREAFEACYPEVRCNYQHHVEFQSGPDASDQTRVQREFQAWQFVAADGKQLIQVRKGGYSFNRLTPYTTLDDYLPEIKRTWECFVNLAAPSTVSCLRLRFINRILLPMADGRVELDDYLRHAPQLVDSERLSLSSFLHQQLAVETATGNQLLTVLTTLPADGASVPLILDLLATAPGPADPKDWEWIVARISQARSLKNLAFQRTLTDKCLHLLRNP